MKSKEKKDTLSKHSFSSAKKYSPAGESKSN